MPSVKNPNGPSQNRLKARASRARKVTSKSVADKNKSRALKADEKRGARSGLLPSSGPRRALGKKQQQKLDRRIANEMKRRDEAAAAAGEDQEEEEEEEEMKDAEEDEEKDDARAIEEQMAMESENIS